MKTFLRIALLPGAVLLLGGCDVLVALLQQHQDDIKAVAPEVSYQEANLSQSPSQKQMEAYYCPVVVPDPFGVTGGAKAICSGAFGSQPSQDAMKVSFDLKFKVKNPNHIPIPVSSLLVGATVFPQQNAQSLGATCITFCADGDPSCTGVPGPDDCKPTNKDLRSIDDYGMRATDLLIGAGVSLLDGETPSFKTPRVIQDAEMTITARFTFGPEPLFNTLKLVASQSIDQLKAGQDVTFTIPYKLEGTVWFDLGTAGRGEVGFGPASGTWVIPAESIKPSF